MGKGLASGVCFNEMEYSIVLVPSIDPVKPKGFSGFPGGIIEDNETPLEAMERELKEEVGENFDSNSISLLMEIPRTGREGSYVQYLFLMRDNGKKLRKTGVEGETGPPIRAFLKDVVSGNIPVFWSHLKNVLLPFLQKINEKDTDPILIQLEKDLRMRLEIAK